MSQVLSWAILGEQVQFSQIIMHPPEFRIVSLMESWLQNIGLIITWVTIFVRLPYRDWFDLVKLQLNHLHLEFMGLLKCGWLKYKTFMYLG